MESQNHLLKITITGNLGSGKTVVGKLLAKKFNLKYYSTGVIQREMAAQRGVTTLELNRHAEISRDIDDAIDNFSRELDHKDENFIIDSRLAWYFIKGAFKVFLKVDQEEAAARIMKDTSRKSEGYHSLEEAITAISNRKKSEEERFFKLYGVRLQDYDNYHLVVNTTHRSLEETVEIVSEHMKQFQNHQAKSIEQFKGNYPIIL